MDNLRIYDQARSVPAEACKSFNNGKFSGTDINPMWRIKKLTELFGPCGEGWYIEVISQRCEQHADDITMAIVEINLYVKYSGEWSKPIYGTGGNVLARKGSSSDEGYKMAYTDAISVACKALGIGADVYFARDKSSKYAEFYQENERQQPAQNRNGMIRKDQEDYILQTCTPDEIQKLCRKYRVAKLEDMHELYAAAIINKLNERAEGK